MESLVLISRTLLPGLLMDSKSCVIGIWDPLINPLMRALGPTRSYSETLKRLAPLLLNCTVLPDYRATNKVAEPLLTSNLTISFESLYLSSQLRISFNLIRFLYY